MSSLNGLEDVLIKTGTSARKFREQSLFTSFPISMRDLSTLRSVLRERIDVLQCNFDVEVV